MNTSSVHGSKDRTVTITFQQTLEAIQERRPCSPKSLRRYFKRLRIKPVGSLRSKPHRFAPETPARILDALGEKVVTMSQLRAVKRQAQKARAA